MKKKITFRPILILFYLSLAIVQVYILNSISTYGGKLNDIDNEIRLVEDNNDILAENIASASSVTTLYNKAKMLGFVTNPPVLSLDPLPVALSSLPSN
ncbi:hypothetical protein HY407_03895 [Candidatus Gottesmanbacteria bacterium]|nr:hypothetical protein [Candidatus Gottesmanbacteria bacterium]